MIQSFRYKRYGRSSGKDPLLRIIIFRGLTALLLAFMVFCTKTQAGQTLYVPGGEIPGAVSDAATGIVRVRFQCLDGERLLEEHSQSGFLAGTKGSEPFVVTAASGLTFDKKKIRKDHDLEDNAQLTERLQIIFQGDTVLEASCLGSSEQKNLAVLKLSQSLTDRYTLSFCTDSPTKDTHLWLLYFPEDMGKDPKEMNYSARTVRCLEGVLMDRMQDSETGTGYLLHTVTEDDAGSLGAPILDEHGWILGMNVITQDDRSAAISTAELQSFAELHKLAYTAQSAFARKEHSNWIYILGALFLAAAVFMTGQILSYRKLRKSSGTKSIRSQGIPLLAGKGKLLYLDRQEEIRLDADRFVLGSAKERTDYLIEGNRKVSRMHAAVTYEKGTYYITDLHSTNGTRVNGQLLIPDKPQKLKEGDLIEIAGLRFVFRD